jgi:tetratricopeptide (TPR) repeat protein
MAGFSRLANFKRVPLGRLSPREVIQLLRDAFRSEALAIKLAGPIALKSDGVPFFVFEMIRGLREGQFITELPDGTFVETRVIEDIEVPSAVRDLVEARLRDLSKEERAILDAGAVQGFRFDADLVARVLERKRIAVLQDLAEIGRRSGVVRADGDDYRFDHHQIQEVVRGDLAPGLRKEYHSMLAEAFADREGIDGAEPEDPPGEACGFLARHHLRGSRPKAALPFVPPALERLAEGYRHDALLDLADRALAVDGLLRGEARVDVLLRKSEPLNLLGRPAEEREALDEALRIADEVGEPALRGKARKNLGTHLLAVSDFDAARKVYREALELSRTADDRKTEIAAWTGLANCDYRQGRYREASRHCERVLEIARETGDLKGQASAVNGLGIAAWSRGRHEEAILRYEEAVSLSREAGDRAREAVSRANVGHALGHLGRAGEALDQFRETLPIAREIGDRRLEAFTIGMVGYAHGYGGELAEELFALEEKLSIARQIGSRMDEGWAVGMLAHVRLRLGDRERAEVEIASATEIAEETGDSLLALNTTRAAAGLAEARGEPDKSRDLARDAVRGARELGIPGETAGSLILLGDLLLEQGTGQEAREALREALALAEENDIPSGIVEAAALLALLPGGDPAAAEAAFAAHEARLSHGGRMEVRFRLWRATGAAAHLEEAHRKLEHLVEHAPDEYRETMIANVPVHRNIAAAWADRQR